MENYKKNAKYAKKFVLQKIDLLGFAKVITADKFLGFN